MAHIKVMPPPTWGCIDRSGETVVGSVLRRKLVPESIYVI